MRRLWNHCCSMHPISQFVWFEAVAFRISLLEEGIDRDSFFCRFFLLFWLLVFVIWAWRAHEVSCAFSRFLWLSYFLLGLLILWFVPLLINDLVLFDHLFNNDMSWTLFLLFLLLITLVFVLVRMVLLIDFDEIALNFLELIHDRKIFLESRDLYVCSTQTQLLSLNSNHAIEKRIEDKRHLQMLLRCGFKRALVFLFELNKIVIRVLLDVLLNLSFECFQTLFDFFKFLHIYQLNLN